MIVILLAVPLGIYFDLSHEHTYSFVGHTYPLGEKFLVSVPSNLLAAVRLPGFPGPDQLRGLEVGRAVLVDRLARVASERQGDRPDRPLAAEDRS